MYAPQSGFGVFRLLSLILAKLDILLGARHAVLETLYSRARRIGLGGVSCLLDGLRKKISFAFSVVMVVCVLLCPALEVVILAEKQKSLRTKSLGRASGEERGEDEAEEGNSCLLHLSPLQSTDAGGQNTWPRVSPFH